MARPNQSDQRREELLPVLAKAFAELGYRRATTASLAKRCELRENQLYRLWPNKKAMFLASIDYLYDFTAVNWYRLLSLQSNVSPAERILQWEGEHRGESGLHRIAFAGLNETDDPDIHDALRKMYRKFHRFVIDQIKAHRDQNDADNAPDAELTAWAVIGLGTMTNILNELGLVTRKQQTRLFHDVGTLLLQGGGDNTPNT